MEDKLLFSSMYRWKPGLGSGGGARGPVLLPTETEIDREGCYIYIYNSPSIWILNSPSSSMETVTRGSTLFV